jgi:Mrp family chromosome partitioning ATPase/capsular polysaccharide biosynthesis protein
MHGDGEELGKAFAPLWARRWLILAIALIVAVATYVYYDHKPRVYLSETTVLLGNSRLEEILRGSAVPLDERILNNQAALLMSSRYSAAVRRRLAREGQRQIPPFSVQVVPGQQNDFLSIEARSTAPKAAALVANALARELISQRRREASAAYRVAAEATEERARRIVGSGISAARERKQLRARVVELETYAAVSQPDARQVDAAFPAAEPLSPRPLRNAVFGFVLGLTFASGIVLLVTRLDRRIRSLADAERVFDRSVLAAIPRLRRPLQSGPRGPEPADGVREPLRRVLTTLQLHRAEAGSDHEALRGARRILITSAQESEGKSVVAANLALVARELGARVALVDADRNAPALSRLLGVGAVPGLSDVGSGRVPIEDAWQRVGVAGDREAVALEPDGTPVGVLTPVGDLMVMTSGSREEASSHPVSETLPSVLDWGEELFDYVIMDSPPPLAVSEALPLLSTVDAVVVVTRLGATKLAAAHRLAELMQRLPTVPFVGIVANDVPDEERDAFGFVSITRSSG